MEAPATFSELINKFIANETSIVANSLPNKHPLPPSAEIGMFPNQAETFYKSQLAFFKMADSKEICISNNKYYFKLLKDMFFLYLPKTAVHLNGTYTTGAGFFTATWVFQIIGSKLVITATPPTLGSAAIKIDTTKYE